MNNTTMGPLHDRDLRTRLTNFLDPLSPIQHVSAASATCFLLFTIASDAVCLFLAPLCSIKFMLAIPFAAIPTSVGVVLPCSAILWILSDIHRIKDRLHKVRSNAAVVLIRTLLYLGVLILLAFPVGMFIVAEMIFPVSALPFVTTLTALMLMQTGRGILRDIPAGRRRALIAVFVVIVLSVKYVDVNTRKPFARHLFLVHRGMTGAEVERIMGAHLKNYVQPESEHFLHLEPHFTGTVMYRHTTEGWANADWGTVDFDDGRAVDAEICLCD